MKDLPGALDELAALVESEPSVRSALLVWPDAVAHSEDAAILRAVARRIRLGAPSDVALGPLVTAAGPDASALTDAVRTFSDMGGSLAVALRTMARTIEHRQALVHEGRAAGAAATLSGRMLALFAGASLLLAPMSRGLTALTVLATGSAAALLGWVGVRWMRRLSPRPPSHDDPVAVHAETLAGLVRSGVHPRGALDFLGGASTELRRAQRLVTLGMSWTDAIAAAGGRDHIRLATILRRGDRLGLPMTDALVTLAAGIRERRRRAFELRSRRAPVLLVAPLALCLLPAFALVVIVPLLRGLSV